MTDSEHPIDDKIGNGENEVKSIDNSKVSKQHLYINYLGVFGLITLLIIIILTMQPPSKTIKAPSVATITITNQGFVPATMKVPNGMQIIWTNIDSKPHQIAADPFPLNNSIVGFNSMIILQPRDSYSFIFAKPGTYTYHDERNPLNHNLHGTIIVKS
ncbi:MAG TPA: cupredoxin domain-containing protein [Candidatus Saccharimonadales bacterium]|nr:cupredoxin domain-containing protein [Candidatus Saccharimonadales bacterium]